MRAKLAGRVEAAGEHDVDLVARRDEETRDAILRAATRSFARRGYRGTRMADVVAEVGITPQVLYQHFATKRDLFVACYRIAVLYMADVVMQRVAPDGDPAARLLWYMHADEGIKAFAPTCSRWRSRRPSTMRPRAATCERPTRGSSAS